MPEIDYNLSADKRWAVLLPKLYKLQIDKRRKLIIDATDYKSGPGLLNTVYMGGVATSMLCSVFNLKYGDCGLKRIINLSDSDTINKGIKCAIHTIEYMLANPVGKCPTCGNIVKK